MKMFARVSLCLDTKGSLHSGNLEFYSLKLSQFELHTTYSNICSSTLVTVMWDISLVCLIMKLDQWNKHGMQMTWAHRNLNLKAYFSFAKKKKNNKTTTKNKPHYKPFTARISWQAILVMESWGLFLNTKKKCSMFCKFSERPRGHWWCSIKIFKSQILPSYKKRSRWYVQLTNSSSSLTMMTGKLRESL